jgi:hypothetical protein
MGTLGNVLGRKMGETALPNLAPRVKPEITVPREIFEIPAAHSRPQTGPIKHRILTISVNPPFIRTYDLSNL